MAQHKVQNLFARAVHVTVYTGAVYLASLPAGGLSWQGTTLVGFSHFVLDGREFVRFWMRHVNRAENPSWLAVVVDQSWHVLVLALVALLF